MNNSKIKLYADGPTTNEINDKYVVNIDGYTLTQVSLKKMLVIILNILK